MFTRIFGALLVTAVMATPAFAAAQPERLTDVEYLKLSRCAAYATLPAMPDERGEALTARVKEQGPGRPAVIETRAAEEANEIRRANRKIEVPEAFKAKRDAACAGF